VNDRGARQIYTQVVWEIKPPPTPMIHVFLWLFVKNKLLTRDNLSKKRSSNDQSCIFCAKNESANHLFFFTIM
jgi:hypothetical protein